MYRPVNASISGASIVMNRLTVLASHRSVTGENESDQLANRFINQPSELSTNPFINQPSELSVINEWHKDIGICVRQ